MTDLRSKTTAASAGLGQVSGGLDAVSAGLGLVSGGLGHVSGGLAQLKGKLSDAAYGLIKVECGLSNTTLSVCDPKVPGLLEGVDLVDAGVSTLVDGVVGKVQGGIGGPKDTAENLRCEVASTTSRTAWTCSASVASTCSTPSTSSRSGRANCPRWNVTGRDGGQGPRGRRLQARERVQ